MLKQTNLEKVKDVAKSMLYLNLNIDEHFSFLCHHPFFVNTVFFVNKTNELLDLTDENQLEKARKVMSEMIDGLDNVSYFAAVIQTPYLPAFFKFTEEYLGEKDYADFLANLWVATEFPNHDANVSVNEFQRYFKKANKELLMTEESLKKYKSLPEEITVYRGICNKATTKALSWTTNKKKAEWFAGRFGNNGKVYQATIHKDDVYAYFNERGESEVVLNYKKLENMKLIKELEKEEKQQEI